MNKSKGKKIRFSKVLMGKPLIEEEEDDIGVNEESKQAVFSVSNFSDFQLLPNVLRSLEGISFFLLSSFFIYYYKIEKLGYEKPTKIQKAAIPHLLKERDVLIKAETGSGKTLAYLIPVIQNLSSLEPKIERSQGTYCVILVPTRELADQVFEVTTKLVHYSHWLVTGAIRGGEKRKSEKARLRKGVTILIATPGRLLDHLNNTQSFEFKNLRWLILDEADRSQILLFFKFIKIFLSKTRLLDMGFERDINTIINIFRSKRSEGSPLQSILCSATLPEGVTRLAGASLRNPVRVEIEKEDEDEKEEENEENEEEQNQPVEEEKIDQFQIPKQLKQYFVQVPTKKRLVTLASFLRWKAYSIPNCKIIVFVSTTDSVDFHAILFGRTLLPEKLDIIEGDETEPLFPIPTFKLHGNLSQIERTKVYTEFNKAKSGILICTDVAARGVDFPNISWIVQYDPPVMFEDYIHRVGRTARIGNAGNSILFVLPSEMPFVELLQKSNIQLKEQSFEKILQKLDSPRVKVEGAVALQWRFENMVEKDEEELASKARSAFLSFTRAYATHGKETKHIFHIKNLHLGHLAKTFGLKDPPSQVVMKGKRKFVDFQFESEQQASQKVQKQNKKAKQVMEIASEFSAGLE